MKTKIQVLMSTYNGEKYLEEQIDSILAQKNVDVNLLVRDDGSKDSTIQILDKYQNEKKLTWYTGENLKSAKSFMDLVFNSDDCDYYAFSDQDDYWLDDKLIVAIDKLNKIEKGIPAIYCSEKQIVNSNLEELPHKIIDYDVNFESAMIRNIATGCTVVFNRTLMDRIKEYKPEYIVMHDSWIYRVCLAIGGQAIYDKNPHIKYRQHENNVIGANEGKINLIKRRVKSFLDCDHSRKLTAIELLNGYSNIISKDKKQVLEAFSECNKFLNKIKLITNKKVKTENKGNNFIFKIAVLTNKI